MPRLTVLPANVTAEVASGELLLHAGERAGAEMEAGCFNCFCGTCVVEVLRGMDQLTPPSDEELEVLDQWNKDAGRWRLSCCARIQGPGEIVIRTGH